MIAHGIATDEEILNGVGIQKSQELFEVGR